MSNCQNFTFLYVDMSDRSVDMSGLYVDVSDLYVDVSDLIVDLSDVKKMSVGGNNTFK